MSHNVKHPSSTEIDPDVAARRKVIEDHGLGVTSDEVPPESLGLALSGGGIRSATVCLGFLQALARHKRLMDFDYLSTVSGGGYTGSFLRSLFVPESDRAPGDKPQIANDPKQTLDFVEKVLSCSAKVELIDDPYQPGQICNPIWWLREHGRYLAPNGPTDFAFAMSYLARNWIALVYTFTIATTVFFWLALCIELGIAKLVPLSSMFILRPADTGNYVVSPIAILPIVLLFLSVGCGAAYWTTVSLRVGNIWSSPIKKAPPHPFVFEWLLLTLIASVALRLLVEFQPISVWDALKFWQLGWPWSLLSFGIDIALTALIFAALCAITVPRESKDAFTNELRRLLTAATSVINQLMAATALLAVIDTIALAVIGPFMTWFGSYHLSGLIGVILPAAAWVIAKIPQWLGGGTVSKWLGEHVWTVALIAGCLLFGLVAVLADVLVLVTAWGNDPWVYSASQPSSMLIRFFGLAVTTLLLLTGAHTGFINLSSLHALYAGRLTRAYMGASNLARLRGFAPNATSEVKPITENHPDDYIDISRYQRGGTAAPIHLINVTLNETVSVSRSQILDRDRKGVPLVFSPGGIWVNAGQVETYQQLPSYDWAALAKENVESFSVGQLCAISGAAVSAGMGMRTTLGGALVFTFANIRLGYWWAVNRLFMPDQTCSEKFRDIRYRVFGTYQSLASEMLARYARRRRRVYLTDGGHFDNTAAYELLRRGVKVIVTCDNGADPNFEFEDFENFVRKARIDLGLAVTVAEAKDVRGSFGKDGARLFLNGGEADWRLAAKAAGGQAFALLLDVSSTTTAKDPPYRDIVRHGQIIWVKPRIFDDLPPDVASYGVRNPTFPQQTTSDQFFDEAQWESYRAVGYSMAELLLTGTDEGIDIFRSLIPRPQVDTAPG